ncbi:hypothetical protein HY251_00405 [bacterium]|nr:hypothetical protein [bacterium]
MSGPRISTIFFAVRARTPGTRPEPRKRSAAWAPAGAPREQLSTRSCRP